MVYLLSISIKCRKCRASVKEYYTECIVCGNSINSVSDVEVVEYGMIDKTAVNIRGKTYAQMLAEGKTDEDMMSETNNVIESEQKKSFYKQLVIWHAIYLAGGLIGLPIFQQFTDSGPYLAFIFGLLIIASIFAFTIYSSGTTIIVPGAAVGIFGGVTADMTRSRRRMFEKLLGPALGYIYALILYSLYYLTELFI